MKTDQQKEKDKEIKKSFHEIKHKESFYTSLASYLNFKSKDVTRNWFYYDCGIPIKFQDIVLDKINLQLQEDKKSVKKVWS